MDKQSDSLSARLDIWRERGGVIHKEKRSKKETRTKGLLPIVLKEGSTPEPKAQEAKGQRSETDQAASRRQAAQIDDYLYQLVMEGIVALEYIQWHAKAIDILSMTRYNVLVVMARRGHTPQNLLVYKVNAAIEYQTNAQEGIEY